MADLDDQLLEGSMDLSSEDHNSQINHENSISFDLIENGQSNNADSQTSADSVSVFYNSFSKYKYKFINHLLRIWK